MTLSNPILQTKFFPPPAITDYVERKEINEKLKSLDLIPLLLVSAPTGFGKSTLVSSWLQKGNSNYAWLSLSENENDYHLFLVYFITAIQQKIEGFGQDILNLISGIQIPPLQVLAEHTHNALADLSEQFFLVLDDYHLIHNKEIHSFITALFNYPNPNFKLIIITRRDPGLPLAEWRVKNRLIEIRATDLQFDRQETIEFFKNTNEFDLDDSMLNKVESITEGWISGMRMLVLSAANTNELNNRINDAGFNDSHIFYQLINEILNNQSPDYREYLLRLSLVKEFNEELFEILCLREDEDNELHAIFENFITDITHSNLFIISLDNKQNWYRFHHFFIEMLQKKAILEFGEEKLNELKIEVANWYLNNKSSDKAIKYYLEAGRHTNAVQVFKELKNELLSNSQWLRLEEIFHQFPKEIIDMNSVLMLTKAWLLIYKGNIPEMLELVNPIEELINQEIYDDSDRENLIGELHVLKAWDRYHFNIDLEACLNHCNLAISKIRTDNPYALGFAWIYYGGAMQAKNNSNEAKQKIYSALEKFPNANLKSLLFLVLCYIEWLDGDLNNLRTTASHLIRLGNEHKHLEAIANGHYFSGVANYFLNELDEAYNNLNQVYQIRYQTVQLHSFFATAALAFTNFEMGNFDEVEKLIEDLEIDAIERGGPIYIKFAKSISAELNWRKDKKPVALKWAKEADFKPILPMSNYCAPQISQAKILALVDDSSSWERALIILKESISFLISFNNINYLIRAYAINALVFYKKGEKSSAYKMLKKAIDLSQPRGFIRPFIELGEQMAEMLSNCNEGDNSKTYIDNLILLIVPNLNEANKKELTLRETQIFQLLDSNLANKEIGNKLFISEKTVKRHLANIYKKLNINSRKMAVDILRRSNHN